MLIDQLPTSPKHSAPILPYCYNTLLQISPRLNRKLSLCLTIIIAFTYAIENSWITALMIYYKTPSLIDSFIWIIPNIIAIIIRPYLIKYANLVSISLNRQVKIVSFWMLLCGFGCLIVAYSTTITKKNYILRIIICSIGWIIMDIAIQLCQYFLNRINQFTDRTFKQSTLPITQKSAALIGSVCGYVLTFLIFMISNTINIKIFLRHCGSLYTLAGCFLILGGIIFQLAYDLPEQQQFSSNQTFNIKIYHIQVYLPGYLQIIKTNVKVICLLITHFCMEFLVDIVLIYATMWITQSASNMGYKQGVAYCIGIRDGSLGLAAYSILTDQIIIKSNFKHLFQGILIVSILFCFFGFWKYQIIWLLATIFVISLCVGIYRLHILPLNESSHPNFITCLQLVQRIQKICVLCIMPFITMILMNRDDVEDCLAWAIGLMLITILTSYLGRQIIKSKNSKSQ